MSTGRVGLLGRASRWTQATIVLMVLVAAVAASTVRDYGVTWDEEHSLDQGERFIAWYLSGFADRRVIDESNFRLYGSLFNALAHSVHLLSGLDRYAASHLLNALVGVTGIGLAAVAGRQLSGPAAGFVAALFLCLTPVYYGHSFANPKDVPFAVAMLGGFVAMTFAWAHLPALPRRIWLGVGVAVGVAMALRVTGVVLLAYLGLICACWLTAETATRSRRGMIVPSGSLLTSMVKITVVAWAVMVVFWPFAQLHPLRNPLVAHRAITGFQEWIAPVRFNGEDVLSDQLSWTYVPIWLHVTLPEFYALALLLVPFAFWRGSPPGGLNPLRRRVLIGVLAAMVGVPLVAVIVMRPVLYDGIRHLLFVVPPLAILSGIAVAEGIGGMPRRSARLLAAAVFAAASATTAWDMARLHPYQYVYFNRIAGGGLAGAAGRFETDYWGLSHKEALDWLVAHYDPPRPGPVKVANCSLEFLTGHYLRTLAHPRFEAAGLEAPPDIVIATTRWDCHERVPGRVIHVVERTGVGLAYVIEIGVAP